MNEVDGHVVSQQPNLLDGSIADNIRYGASYTFTTTTPSRIRIFGKLRYRPTFKVLPK